MIRVKQKGDFSKTHKFLNNSKKLDVSRCLAKYAEQGLQALSSATPIDTGETSASWYYKIEQTKNGYSLKFFNSHKEDGVPIAIILQYGHATRNGGWVEGRDYINPAIGPIFDKIAKDAWREVTTK